MAIVGVRELKSRLSHYLRLARTGERVTVTDRGKPVAIIGPAEEGELERKLWQLVREGFATWSGGKPTLPDKLIKLKGKPLSETIIEDREDRV